MCGHLLRLEATNLEHLRQRFSMQGRPLPHRRRFEHVLGKRVPQNTLQTRLLIEGFVRYITPY